MATLLDMTCGTTEIDQRVRWCDPTDLTGQAADAHSPLPEPALQLLTVAESDEQRRHTLQPGWLAGRVLQTLSLDQD